MLSRFLLYVDRNLNGWREKQIVHLYADLILLGLQKPFDVTLNFMEGLYKGHLSMNIEGRGVYKVTTIDLSWFPLSII